MQNNEVNLVLASGSPRRQALLELAGVHFRVAPASVDERPVAGESPDVFTRRVAALKAEAVATTCRPDTWVLAADTTVVVDAVILGKPVDAGDASRMLDMLSGRRHRVLTAVVLHRAGSGIVSKLLAETEVRFRSLHPELIEGYVQTGEPMDKAGAYGIQGQGALLVETIDGSYTNVVGLPLAETVQMLERSGLWKPFAQARR